jgi:zinc and cadmium transporter
MTNLAYILLFTFLSGIVSLLGGALLLMREKFALKISHYLASFAAGTLLGAAFFDLLPEAAHEAEEMGVEHSVIFFWTLVGILGFFLLERFIHWFHHHHEHGKTKDNATASLVILGDSVHNFIDGVVIASTFMVSIPLGIVTSLAVAAHEIPQEIGDFGVLLHRGLKRKKILILNLLSACVAVLGAVIAYLAAESLEPLLPIFLSISAGFFIYIAASDLIPEIHNEDNRKTATIETLLLIAGVVVVYFLVGFLGHE